MGVAESLPPSRARVDCLRLLGVGRPRPKFWLYETSGGGFGARAFLFRLQALGDCPADAIERLRQNYLRYAQRYPIHQDASQKAACRSEGVRDTRRADYENTIYWIRQDIGFWRGAEFFLRAAAEYRRRLRPIASNQTVVWFDGLACSVEETLGEDRSLKRVEVPPAPVVEFSARQ